VPDGKEWSGVRWRGDDAGDGIGAGTISLTLDPAARRASGVLDGVLGAARIVGIFADGGLAASVERMDPTDRGFTGTLLGNVANDKPGTLNGTMRLSLGDGRLIRDGTFSLSKAP